MCASSSDEAQMQPFLHFSGIAAPIDGVNIDTDRIIPSRFLRKPRSGGYGQFLFHDLRFDAEGLERPDFVLNAAPFRRAQILVCDTNFGCGSAREGAVYALADFGIRAVIAPSFSDIFTTNCLRNGIVAAALPADAVAAWRARLAEGLTAEIQIDLAQQRITGPDGASFHFDINPGMKARLMLGVDDIEWTLRHAGEIQRFEERHLQAFAWWFPGARGA
jgi:3-isopropylmalate/(R)-2-methylmalate dehydratase small subunit